MARKYDAIILGGGHHGLVCAAYLARAGRDVLVLERRHVLGGAAVTEELHPGFKFSVCSYVVSLLRPQIIRELRLARHGLEILPLEAAFTPYPDGRSLCRWADPHQTFEEIRRFSPRDAEAYGEFGLEMNKMGQFVKPILEMTPPDLTAANPLDWMELLKMGKRFGDLKDRRARLVKLMTMSSADLLDEWFESDHLKAPMAVSGIIGTFLGVRSPGTAYVLLHHYMGEIDGAYRSWGFAKGGTGAVSMSIARAAESYGAEILTESPVDHVIIEGGQATGVVLKNGDEHRARHVISGVDPHLTFLKLVGQDHLDDEFTKEIKRFKMRGSSGKVNLALDRAPNFVSRPGLGPHLCGDIAIAPSVEYLERAYDDAKYGDFSRKPYLNVVLPSMVDPSVAPPGKHIMSIFVQYAPYNIKEGAARWPEKREAFGDAVIDTLEEYCPGLRDSILFKQVLTPWDLEQEFGLTEGNIFHGELSLEQLFFLRPSARWSRYRTPIDKLWLCGSGAHPGGGLMGAPGANAARDLLNSGEI